MAMPTLIMVWDSGRRDLDRYAAVEAQDVAAPTPPPPILTNSKN
jgi:hypothetical protein